MRTSHVKQLAKPLHLESASEKNVDDLNKSFHQSKRPVLDAREVITQMTFDLGTVAMRLHPGVRVF